MTPTLAATAAVRRLEPGVSWLLGPKIRARVNRARTERAGLLKIVVLGGVALAFWALVFAVILRMLLYFRGTQGIGDLLAGKLLGIALLTFLSILLLSNVIASLSTFFLSRDLELLTAAPVGAVRLYLARLVETIINSSWMVALMVVPILVAYGTVYGAGLGYVIASVLVLIPFLVLPAVVGTGVTLLLVNLFPARRTRDLLALAGLLAAGVIVALFRFLQPERLMRPEEFRDLVDFMAVLRTPTSVWLPSQWASDALMSTLTGSFDVLPFLLLGSTAAAALVGGSILHERWYRAGYTRAQEGAERRDGRGRSQALEIALRPFRPATRQLVAKEIRLFLRDATQWSQLVLLGVLVVVYVYNIKVLPLYSGEQLSFLLVNAISFLNLGLAGFVVAAIAARFVFPAMSLEGRMLWLLRSSPLDVRSLFWVKYWVGTVPLLLVALPLIVVTNLILQASPFVTAVSTITMVGFTFALTGLALGFGALFPNFDTENAAEIPTSFGGLMFMIAAVTYLATVVALEAWPVTLFLQGRIGDGGFGTAPVIMGLGGAALLTALVMWLPLRAGVRRVEQAGSSAASA